MNNLTIVQQINSGICDADLDQIMDAVRDRKERQQRQVFNSLTEGQRIWLNDQSQPSYLVGREAVVMEVKRTRIRIKLVQEHTGERFHGAFTAPMSLISTTKPAYAV